MGASGKLRMHAKGSSPGGPAKTQFSLASLLRAVVNTRESRRLRERVHRNRGPAGCAGKTFAVER
jgi:hypothetical protein